jgi:hypothetical protein
MAEVTVAAEVPLSPEAATALWRDPRRWPGFVEGFQRVESGADDWPAEGAKLVWVSGEGGRGRVTEKVRASAPTEFRTRVVEDRLVGTQWFTAAEHGDGCRVEIGLEYELTSESPLKGVTDLLFIRRALRDALGRTLRRFAVEAHDEAGLR